MSGGVVSIVLVESSRRIWSLKQFFAGELVCAEFSLRLEFGRTVLGLNLASEMVGQRNLLLQLRSELVARAGLCARWGAECFSDDWLGDGCGG